jgi:predicted HTH transcriptional regulator
VEQVASGIPRMRDAMKDAGLPEPTFIADGGFFTVAFKRPKKDDIINGIIKPSDGTIKSKNDTVNDTVKPKSDTVNDTVKPKSDTIKSENDTVNDTVKPKSDTVKSENDTVKPKSDTVKPKSDTVNDTVKLKNDTVKTKNDTVKPKNDTVNLRTIENIILENIKEKEGLSAPDIAKIVNKSIITAKRHLGALKKAGKIEFRGAPKTGGYYLKNN